MGKGSWFPLAEGSPRAYWDDRCTGDERVMLLDPTKESDIRLLTVGADGYIKPSQFCVGLNKARVAVSAKLFGLNLPKLKEARLKVMREIDLRAKALEECISIANDYDAVADRQPIDALAEAITELTRSNSPYALAARSKLRELGLSVLIES